MSPLNNPGDPTGFAKKSRLWVPGDPTNERDSKIVSAKRLLVPTDRDGKPIAQADDQEITIAKPFNHSQRRWHVRYAARLRKQQDRRAMRRAIRGERALFDIVTQHYDPFKRRIVRYDSTGKPLTVVARPPIGKIQPRIGYFQKNGPAKLAKTERQIKFEIASEAGNHIKATFEPRIDHLGNPVPANRLRGSYVPGPADRGDKVKVEA